MKKSVLLFLAFLFCSSLIFSQQNDSVRQNPYSKSTKEKPNITEKMYFGGTLMLTFGSYTSIGIWPLVGYKATPKLSFGLQPGYEYVKYDDYYGGTYETSNYGLRVLTRYRVIPQAYLHAEYATINYEIQTKNAAGDIEESREWVPFLFLGAGLSQHMGGNTYAYVQVLFDVINSENSPYRNGAAFWSFGIIAGF